MITFHKLMKAGNPKEWAYFLRSMGFAIIVTTAVLGVLFLNSRHEFSIDCTALLASPEGKTIEIEIHPGDMDKITGLSNAWLSVEGNETAFSKFKVDVTSFEISTNKLFARYTQDATPPLSSNKTSAKLILADEKIFRILFR